MMLVPKAWLPKCNPKRIICHWTAGGYKATDTDRWHYHILVEGDGNIVRGYYDIADNMTTGDGVAEGHPHSARTR